MVVPPERSTLLQLMGFPKAGIVSALTVHANWPAVRKRLSTHPQEASVKDPIRSATTNLQEYPLFLALLNQSTPLTKDALEGFIHAYPNIVTKPRSLVVSYAMRNAELCSQYPGIVDDLVLANPRHLTGRLRTRTFELMGFSPLQDGAYPQCRWHSSGEDYQVDWNALENHLKDNLEEASKLCTGWPDSEPIFPLEAAIHFEDPPVPLSVVELLLRLCPEAATQPDSCALAFACNNRGLEDPEVIRAILRANPKLAALQGEKCCANSYGGTEK